MSEPGEADTPMIYDADREELIEKAVTSAFDGERFDVGRDRLARILRDFAAEVERRCVAKAKVEGAREAVIAAAQQLAEMVTTAKAETGWLQSTSVTILGYLVRDRQENPMTDSLRARALEALERTSMDSLEAPLARLNASDGQQSADLLVIRRALEALPTMDDRRRVGSYAYCSVCNMPKKPRGRSAPLVLANGFCDHECSGYALPPFAGDLWPGETAEEFGYPCETTEERNA